MESILYLVTNNNELYLKLGKLINSQRCNKQQYDKCIYYFKTFRYNDLYLENLRKNTQFKILLRFNNDYANDLINKLVSTNILHPFKYQDINRGRNISLYNIFDVIRSKEKSPIPLIYIRLQLWLFSKDNAYKITKKMYERLIKSFN